MQVSNNALTKELLISSYESRLLFSRYNLLELSEYPLALSIENDLQTIYDIFSDMKIKCDTFNNLVFLFYKWAHNVKQIEPQLLNLKKPYEFFLLFLMVHKELYMFMSLIDDCVNLNDLDEDERNAVKSYIKNFKSKYVQLGYITDIYRSVIKQISLFLQNSSEEKADIEEITGLVEEELINNYFLITNSIDHELFMNSILLAKDMFNTNFVDRYGDFREKIFNSVSKIGGINQNCFMRDYEFAYNNEKFVYKIIFAKFDICSHTTIYSNLNLIHICELNGVSYDVFKHIQAIDKFVLWYQVNVANIKNFLYNINKCEQNYNVVYYDTIKKHYLHSLAKASEVIDKQIDVLFARMPQSEVFSFFNVLQNKIFYNIRSFFYDPNKNILKSFNKNGAIDAKHFTIGECRMLFDSVSSLMKEIFTKRSQNVKAEN